LSRIKAIRGMNDILPEQTPVWRYLEDTVRELFAQYGIEEIRLPVVEQTELFKRSIGEVTDIVEKEMYTFQDRNGDSLTLRPEGTAGCVRAGDEHGLLFNQVRRLWYCGPMFRHERPQKGRYRQFHQIGAECFGLAGPDIDAELITLTARLWRTLGLSDMVRLELNTIGTAGSRDAYKTALVEFLSQHQHRLDDDSKQRLLTNPLRILDSKNPDTQALLQDAPVLMDYLDEESREHFSGLCSYLDNAGIAYYLNSKLVRGLDYYGKTVFEWTTSALGAQGTICAGGRYDGLVKQLGGRETPAVGFAIGVERLVLMLNDLQALPEHACNRIDCYIISMAEEANFYASEVAEKVRDLTYGYRALSQSSGSSLKAQMKKADKSGARVALLLGESELAGKTVTVKPLRTNAAQQTLPLKRFLAEAETLIGR